MNPNSKLQKRTTLKELALIASACAVTGMLAELILFSLATKGVLTLVLLIIALTALVYHRREQR
jgi:hypothetical protein